MHAYLPPPLPPGAIAAISARGLAEAAPTPTSPTCLPWWSKTYTDIAARGKAIVRSGCATVAGNVMCDPESMRAKAEAALRAGGWWKEGRPLSLSAYTLARYMQSEIGSTSLYEAVAVGEAAVNRAKLQHRRVLDVLLYNQPASHPNYGHYGPIHGSGGVSTAPYGRWAATSMDPSIANLMIADLIMSGKSANFNQGGDDQVGLHYFADPEEKIRREAAQGDYWVGPLPGVDPWHTFLFRHVGVKPSSPQGAALLARGLAFVAPRARDGNGKWVSTSPKPVTGLIQTCPTPLRELPASQLLAAASVGTFAMALTFLLVRKGFRQRFHAPERRAGS